MRQDKEVGIREEKEGKGKKAGRKGRREEQQEGGTQNENC